MKIKELNKSVVPFRLYAIIMLFFIATIIGWVGSERENALKDIQIQQKDAIIDECMESSKLVDDLLIPQYNNIKKYGDTVWINNTKFYNQR